jgi:hypothetical protein
MRALRLNIAVEKLRLEAPFRISGYVFEEQEVVVVTLDDGLHRGRGEASGVYYLGDTAQTMVTSRFASAGRCPQCGGLCVVGTRRTASAQAGLDARRTAAGETAGHDIYTRRR